MILRKAAVAMCFAAAAFACGSGTPAAAPRLAGNADSGWVVEAPGARGAGHLQVFIGAVTPAATEQPPVLGETVRSGDGLRWHPRYPLVAGQTYTAVWRPEVGVATSTTLVVPAVERAPTTVVADIYPSSPVVPANLLRVYVQFSAPMSKGQATRSIELVAADGVPIAGAFVVPEQELWSPAGDRLTLFFDPGRLKQDVGPNLDVGTPLRAGQRVTLKIAASWLDGEGVPLRSAFERTWQVIAADRRQPAVDDWSLRAPEGPTRPLNVTFPEPLDHALLLRMLHVRDNTGKPVAGTVAIAAGEEAWSFLPASRWLPGHYELMVEADLEDLGGNSLERLFDEPLRTDAVGRPQLPALRLPFTVEAR